MAWKNEAVHNADAQAIGSPPHPVWHAGHD
jgi:hypothetical protein